MTASSVVIVSYKPTEWLGRSIDSVREHAGEVIVVDNGSAGGQAGAIAREHGARSLPLPENTGFAGGATAGIRAAKGDIVALLNDDAVASPNWLAAAAEVLADRGVGAVGPKIVLPGRYAEFVLPDEEWQSPGDPRTLGRQIRTATVEGEDVLARLLGPGIHRLEAAPEGDDSAPPRWRWTAGGGRPIYLPSEGDVALEIDGEVVRSGRVVSLLNSAGCYLRKDGYAGDVGDSTADDAHFDQAEERFSVTGAAMVVRAETFGRLGCFAERFFAYYEDTDWCWRARLAGLRHVYDPAATVEHARGQTSGGTSAKRVQYLAERNRLLCLLRNAPLRMAMDEVRRKRVGGGDDGVAEAMPRYLPVGLAGRVANRRRWRLSPVEVFEHWAGRTDP